METDMAEVGAVAGTLFYIGTTESTPSPDDWVVIEDVANIGDLGTTFSKIVRESIGDGYTRQIKGTESVPTFPLVMNRDDDDAGQVAVLAASADRNSFYNFRVVENDGTVIVFQGRVFGFMRKYGGVNNLKQISCDIEVEPDSISVS
jgi:hypothetical protein